MSTERISDKSLRWWADEGRDLEIRWMARELQARRKAHAEILAALNNAKEFIENLQLPDAEWDRVLDITVAAIAKGEEMS